MIVIDKAYGIHMFFCVEGRLKCGVHKIKNLYTDC